jgi:hypothetical protein
MTSIAMPDFTPDKASAGCKPRANDGCAQQFQEENDKSISFFICGGFCLSVKFL